MLVKGKIGDVLVFLINSTVLSVVNDALFHDVWVIRRALAATVNTLMGGKSPKHTRMISFANACALFSRSAKSAPDRSSFVVYSSSSKPVLTPNSFSLTVN
jgi:hypothetical protein